MSRVMYEIVEHDGGWAYKVDGVFSETFANREDAHDAGAKAAAEQMLAGSDEATSYEDKDGRWHSENVRGDDRPTTSVTD